MLQSTSTLMLPSEFDPFLFALLDGDESGPSVSVLSALARSDLDPLDEAAKLARLTQEAAAESLASTIVSLCRSPLISLNAESVAARLVALLPQAEASLAQQEKDPPIAAVRKNRSAVIFAIVINGLLMAFAFGHQGTATNSPATGPAKETHATLSESPAPSKVIADSAAKTVDGPQKPHL